MFARRLTATEPVEAASPAAVVAGIPKSARLQLVEANLFTLRQRRSDILDERRQLAPRLTKRETDLAGERRARELDQECATVEAAIVETRRERATLREPY